VTRWCSGTDTLFLDGLRQGASKVQIGFAERGDVARDPRRELEPPAYSNRREM